MVQIANEQVGDLHKALALAPLMTSATPGVQHQAVQIKRRSSYNMSLTPMNCSQFQFQYLWAAILFVKKQYSQRQVCHAAEMRLDHLLSSGQYKLQATPAHP
jgi:hypothetical protein